MFHGSVHRSAAAPALAPARSWRRWTALLLIAVLSLNACYATRPVAGAPAPETRVVLELNDRGRLEYGDRIGPSVREVEGVVQSASDSSYVVRIASVRYLNGRMDRWSGEPFAFSTTNLGRVQERELSRSRTALVAAAVTAGVAVLIGTINLLGTSAGRGPNDTKNPPSGS